MGLGRSCCPQVSIPPAGPSARAGEGNEAEQAHTHAVHAHEAYRNLAGKRKGKKKIKPPTKPRDLQIKSHGQQQN